MPGSSQYRHKIFEITYVDILLDIEQFIVIFSLNFSFRD